jgi:hypothetical protein
MLLKLFISEVDTQLLKTNRREIHQKLQELQYETIRSIQNTLKGMFVWAKAFELLEKPAIGYFFDVGKLCIFVLKRRNIGPLHSSPRHSRPGCEGL